MDALKLKYKKAENNNKKLLALRPLPEETLQSLKDYYRIGLTYSSNALEGNSLTESETKIVIEDGLTIDGKPLHDIYEAIGHAKAYDYIWQLAMNKTLEESDILLLHRFFYEMIDSEKAGVYRKVPVFISGSQYPVTPAGKIPSEMKKFVDWFNHNENNFHSAEFAALVHKKFVFIHPFIDGNGRLARLLMNLALLRNEYSIALISAVLRPEYIRLLELAHTNDEPFKEFIADRIIETQNDLLRLFKEVGQKSDRKSNSKPDNGDGGVNETDLYGSCADSGRYGIDTHIGGVNLGESGGVNGDVNGGAAIGRRNNANYRSGGVNGDLSGGVNGDLSGGVNGDLSGGVNNPAGVVKSNDTENGLNESNPLPHTILELIRNNPGINTPAIANKLGISLRTSQRYLKLLVDNHQIVFVGPFKTGGYHLTENNIQ